MSLRSGSSQSDQDALQDLPCYPVDLEDDDVTPVHVTPVDTAAADVGSKQVAIIVSSQEPFFECVHWGPLLGLLFVNY